MAATRLTCRSVEKPWGRRDIPACFEAFSGGAEPVGEIWFEDPGDPGRPLLIKYLFTSERLSIQVHPDREAAVAAGHSNGKDEAWLIVGAGGGAEIGIGLNRLLSRAELRRAAEDGSIVDLVGWRSVAVGDFYYSPAGTIHALGAGLAIIEIQQNVDVTYRLYDYGRPRELHLEEGVAAATPEPFQNGADHREIGDGRTVLKEGGAFVVERWTGEMTGLMAAGGGFPVWIIPITGGGSIGEEPFQVGEVWVADGAEMIGLERNSAVLVAYEADRFRPDLIG